MPVIVRAKGNALYVVVKDIMLRPAQRRGDAAYVTVMNTMHATALCEDKSTLWQGKSIV